MIDINSYIQNGRVQKEKIALDIKRGAITRDEIRLLVENDDIKNAFFIHDASWKTEKSNWDKEYLDRLSYAAAAECFNEEYLYYLYDVSNFVNHSEKFKKVLLGVVIIAFLVAVIIIISKAVK